MEQQLGSLILATDISRQNEFLSTFKEHLDNQDLDLQLASHRHFMLQVYSTPPHNAPCSPQEESESESDIQPSIIFLFTVWKICYYYSTEYIQFLIMIIINYTRVHVNLSALRLPWSVQTSVTRVGFGSSADSGVRECVRSSTDRVSKASSSKSRFKKHHLRTWFWHL